MKILLFGGSGQLGLEIQKRVLDLNFGIASPVSSEVNVTEREQVLRLAQVVKPDVVINCAAYTAVDKAEEEPERAYAINRDGARNAAEAAEEVGARCFYVSTDYVFSGDEPKPLAEDEPVAPINVYGASKLAGEEEVLKVSGGRGLVIRTSSLFGRYGPNFVATMLKLLDERGEVRVVKDQVMSPTWAGWLAETILDLCRIEISGILHASCRGEVSWCGFAEEILKLARKSIVGGDDARVVPVTAADFPRPARRPSYSVFDCSRLTKALGRPPITWQEALREYLQEIGRIVE